MSCTHNSTVNRPLDYQHAWECAECFYIFGLGDDQIKVISGGQTGIDQLALSQATAMGIPTGGYIPKGWLTENGPDPSLERYGLREHPSAKYPPRTWANVKWADGTLWFGQSDTRGLRCTTRAVDAYGRPFLYNPNAEAIRSWRVAMKVRVINVAGPRGSNVTDALAEHVRRTLSHGLR